MRSLLPFVSALLLAFPGLGLPARGADSMTEEMNKIVARIVVPKFPNKDFVITDYGAVAGQDCSEAIKASIKACVKSGGGRVVVPAGEWTTGPVVLKSNVNLHVAEGALLRFDPNPQRYLPVVRTRYDGVECMNYSPLIYAWKERNVAITGKGTIDGGASEQTWWAWNDRGKEKPPLQRADRKHLFQTGNKGVPVEQRIYGDGYHLRPMFIQPYRCKNVLIEGVTLLNSPEWQIHPVLCESVTVRSVTVRSTGPNTDGCDPESCNGVLIEDCNFSTGDDCIAIKSGREADGKRINVPAQNIVIRNCKMSEGHGGLTIGSEIAGGCKRVFVSNCEMDSPHLNQGIRIKNNAVEGGTISDIFIRDVTIGRVRDAVSIEFNYDEGPNGPYKPILRNVLIEGLKCRSSQRNLFVSSYKGAVIEGIKLKNCTFQKAERPDSIDPCRIELDGVTMNPPAVNPGGAK